MRNATVIAATVAVTIALATCGTTRAGTLEADPNGMAAFQGSIFFDGFYTDATLDYCVYEPGMFDQSFGGAVPAVNAQHYVYAYQVIDPIGGMVIPAWNYVNQFSVGLNGNEQVDVIGYYDDGSTGQVMPASSIISIDLLTAVWTFDPAIQPSQHSPILYFSSPYAPEWDQSTMSGAMPLATHDVPSPTPEPATLMLLVMGGAAVLARRRAARA